MTSRISEQYTLPYTQNRDISWLKFNMRVLDEADNPSVPLFERLRFLFIFSSNLDEFFMIRIGSQFDFVNVKKDVVDWRTGNLVSDVIRDLFEVVESQIKRADVVYETLSAELLALGIAILKPSALDDHTRADLHHIFDERIRPLLDPMIIHDGSSLPDLDNHIPHLIARLINESGQNVTGLVMIPAIDGGMVRLPGAGMRFVSVSDIIEEHCDCLFPRMSVVDRTVFSLTRNADINLYDDLYDDAFNMRIKVKELLDVRRHLSVDRIKVMDQTSDSFRKHLATVFHVDDYQVHSTKIPLGLSLDFIKNNLARMRDQASYFYPPFEPVWPISLNPDMSVMRQVEEKDILTHMPYESFDPVIRLLAEAAKDPEVESIMITIYRLAAKANLIEQLILAAEQGKEVLVVMELRARFDELNNIIYSERLERAGCRIVHGLGTYKVHSKIILVTKKQGASARYLTQIGTGNYHETTVRQYTDLSLMTAHEGIGIDAERFFLGLQEGTKPAKLNHLVVAPLGFRRTLLNHIATETKKGSAGRIRIKVNAITESQLMEALVAASNAGVRIDLIARSITCLLPGIKGYTENIRIVAIVGRFLEHARIYAFGEHFDAVYLSSADMMTRNAERRIEIATPVYDQDVVQRIKEIFDIQLKDGIKGKLIDNNGSHTDMRDMDDLVDSQDYFIKQISRSAFPVSNR